ncbi:MAG TPA: cyclic nucleotide-binding domain-containing protein [Vicinamibacterales bacterium]|nr:cyclic nucleotide-binding domain-containing protein [Vicinamibacterales bacterium]
MPTEDTHAEAVEPASRGVDPSVPPIAGATPIPLEELRTLPFLEGVGEADLRSLGRSIWQRSFVEGEQILRAGQYGDAAFVILEGYADVRLPGLAPAPPSQPSREGLLSRVARVLRREGPGRAAASSGVTPDGTIVLADFPVDARPGYEARLQPGDIFGEVSALSRYPHATDVVALTDMRCVVLSTPVLRRLKNEVDAFGEMVDNLYVERTLDIHLARVDLFAGLPPEVRKALRAGAELLRFSPNQEIVAQGSPCEEFYLVRGGYVRVAVHEGETELSVTYLRKGDYAGEIGLMLDQPWPMSLTAIEHVELVRIGREDFRRALASSPRVEDELWAAVVDRLKERGFALRNPRALESLAVAMDTGLIHGESVLLIDLNTCTKCDDCVRACATTHGGTPRFVREGIRVSHYSVPTACYQCTDPVCMIGCPTGAISRPLGTLEVIINEATCIGCHRCVNGCPWHNIVPVPYYSPTLGRQIELATKCDLCVGRDEGPACVQMCPHGSAVRVDLKNPAMVRDLFS